MLHFHDYIGESQSGQRAWLQSLPFNWAKKIRQTPVADACGGVPSNASPVTGWIPAYDAEGEPYIWFSSMGC